MVGLTTAARVGSRIVTLYLRTPREGTISLNKYTPDRQYGCVPLYFYVTGSQTFSPGCQLVLLIRVENIWRLLDARPRLSQKKGRSLGNHLGLPATVKAARVEVSSSVVC